MDGEGYPGSQGPLAFIFRQRRAIYLRGHAPGLFGILDIEYLEHFFYEVRSKDLLWDAVRFSWWHHLLYYVL